MHDFDPKFWPLDMRDRCRSQATFGTVLVLFVLFCTVFKINDPGLYFYILATIQARAWAANPGHFWYFILATVHPE